MGNKAWQEHIKSTGKKSGDGVVLSELGWNKLRSTARDHGVPTYRRTREEIERDLGEVLNAKDS